MGVTSECARDEANHRLALVSYSSPNRSPREPSCVKLRSAEREARGLRDRLVVNYSPLVRYVAGRVSGRLAGPLDQEDLISSGLFGLLGAVETYDPGRRSKFESYAISKILWSMLDELRKVDPLSRRTRLRAHQTERASDGLVQKLGRAPTESELVMCLGISVTEHRAFLDQYARAQVRSFEAWQEGPVGGLHDLIGDHSATDPASAAEMAEVRARLVGPYGRSARRSVSSLPSTTSRPYAQGDGRSSTSRRPHPQILHKALPVRHSLSEQPLATARSIHLRVLRSLVGRDLGVTVSSKTTHARRRVLGPGGGPSGVQRADCEARAEDTNHLKREVEILQSTTERVGIRELLEAGVHFGHQAKRWNPKMKRYIFAQRAGVHIIDLDQTLTLLGQALDFVRGVAEANREVLFVGTKKQAQIPLAEEALRSGQPFVAERYIGGMLTNFRPSCPESSTSRPGGQGR